MSSEHPDTDEQDLDHESSAQLSAILGDPSVWETTDPADEVAILAAIGELRDSDTLPGDRPIEDRSNVVPISTARRWMAPFVAGVAASALFIGGFIALTGDVDRSGTELALTATDLAPDAVGVVEIIDTPNGTVLLLDVSGLPPAPAGSYYEAWVRKDAEVGVSAGTFHLRGGGSDSDSGSDSEIELWAGVTTNDYPLFTITLQDEADPVSSGRVVLRGLLDDQSN